MVLRVQVPDDAADALRVAWGAALDRAALEALVIEGYRSRKFGLSTVRRLLGLPDRWQTEAWLAQRGVSSNYSVSDFEADCAALDELRRG